MRCCGTWRGWPRRRERSGDGAAVTGPRRPVAPATGRRPRRAGVTGGVLLLRLTAAAAATAALLLPLPGLAGALELGEGVAGGGVAGLAGPAAAVALVAIPVPVLVGLWPGGPWASLAMTVSVLQEVLTAAQAGTPGAGTVMGLAVAYTVLHTASAAAATLPVDAVVAPALLQGWAGRTAGVLAACAPPAALVLALPRAGSAPGWLTLLGLAATVGVAAVLVALLHRSDPG